jgi:beta-glucosidase
MKQLGIIFTLLSFSASHTAPEAGNTWDWRHADWSTIKTAEATFPQADFLWGAATSAHQAEGNCTNNTWSRWEAEGHCEEPSGTACDHWNRYKEDIQLLKKAGLNAYRFSIEWSKIEPREGEFDEAALKHYEDVCDELVKNDIRPCVTLHHYTDPLWFADKGGFEKESNIHYFVEFCEKVIDRLHGKVHLWFTFNSPCGYAAKGYLIGATPPAKKDMALMAEVYKNLLEAHVQVYRTLKPRYHTGVKIGILNRRGCNSPRLAS